MNKGGDGQKIMGMTLQYSCRVEVEESHSKGKGEEEEGGGGAVVLFPRGWFSLNIQTRIDVIFVFITLLQCLDLLWYTKNTNVFWPGFLIENS